ncbi:hypothetical protein ACWEOZ_12590 [Actinoplanes sp. NPDC004185]
MAYVKYTREMLSEAVAASTSMAGVLRHLGLRQTGGAHAHLRRRIAKLNIDTSHFLGSAHNRGTHSFNRRRSDQILVLRPSTAGREKPHALRRALEEVGLPKRCAECNLADSWRGRQLVLHVDHIDGRLWDCRPENLRFLCPNCHSQTATYAGRKSKQLSAALVQVDDNGIPVADAPPPPPLSEADVLRLLARVSQKTIGPSEAARLIGCSREQVYRLQKRLAERGSIATAARQPALSQASRGTVLAFSLAHPDLGPRKIAAALRRPPASVRVSPSTVSNVLTRAGLSTREKRVAAAREA